jgi:hypothetical protein
MDGIVLFIKHPVCGYKQLAIAFGLKFYWTEALSWLSIEVAKVLLFTESRCESSPRRPAHRQSNPARPH